ncbi:TonB-dependent receptor [Flammeovirga sp. MY04]|uniref:TonB-dependent receptor n=1 Tax=Flammeovirga sp. MY04 TaxID=1191459 RepID=UPI0008060F7A|nr:carboxypeptidase-like regulatory domain-containing protein [Flammeovirga sp. MY04]ANQ49373.1 TonB-dependent receptor [Flammeovirga sp. MY04]
MVAQEKKYPFAFREATYLEAIDAIAKMCEVNFIYSDDNIPMVKRINFNKEASLVEILHYMFDGKFLDFRIDDDDVIVTVRRIPLDSKEGRRMAKYTVSGIVREKFTNETIIGASIYFDDLDIGTVTNVDGFFSISVPLGKYNIRIKSLGFQGIDTVIQVNKEYQLNMKLDVRETKLKEVLILSSNSEIYDGVLELSNITKVSPEITKELPMILGEGDVIKSLQLMPGFKSANEGSSELSVRGGRTDQNLFLIDNVPIYNATHSLGFYSIFNTNSLKSVKTYKSGLPAQYGGRGSSVIDVHLREGNSQNYNISGGVGTISANLTLEGPIKKDKSSFIISGRRPYTDLFQISGEGLNSILFYDLSTKLKFQLDEKNTITTSGYFSRDRLAFEDVSSSEWGNNTANVTWTSLLSSKLYSNLSLWYTHYNVSNIINSVPETSYRTSYTIDDLGLKYNLEHYLTPFLTLKGGVESMFHLYNSGDITPYDQESIITPTEAQDIRSLESAGYFDVEWNIADKVKLGIGGRYSRFDNFKNKREYIPIATPLGTADTPTTTALQDTIYNEGLQINNTHHNFDPRLSISVGLTKTQSVRLAYDRMSQYAQELNLSTLPSNAGVWVPANEDINPLINNQFSIGYINKIKDGAFDISLDAYYKDSENILELKPNGQFVSPDNLLNDVSTGIGRSYGFETLFRKRKGTVTGSISYTWSYSQMQVDGINNNNWYATNQDQRHVFNILASFEITKQIQFSAVWNYASGRPFTSPIGKHHKDGYVIPIYGDRNAARLPSTHHLDISLTFYRKMHEQKRNESSFNFSIYNVYARKNTYSYIFRSNSVNPEQLETVKVYLFSILPSFSYNFKF